MTDNLYIMVELAVRENLLITKVNQTYGTVEDKFKQLSKKKVFHEYRIIHQEYTNLISDIFHGLEALKRALFLQWYSISEPACFTGISTLNKTAEKQVFEKLLDKIKDRDLDKELLQMLSWYYSISDWYFDSEDKSGLIKQYLERNSQEPEFTKTIQKATLENRGQMGKYWISVIESQGSLER